MYKEITEATVGGIAARHGICTGDSLVSINGKPVNDIFDYRYLVLDTKLNLEIKKKDGSHVFYDIKKNEYDDLGLCFESGLMDNAKSCANKCIFCFIDQLPGNMRKSLYFKDDDSRLSFLHGNYVTLTNMSKLDLERIAYYHLSPINVSVHSTDPDLRTLILKNPNAANIKEQLTTLKRANIEMNFQIVLCKNINDGLHLEKTIIELGEFMPNAHSLSVVPAGLTDFREGLHRIDGFTSEDALNIIKQIDNMQRFFLKKDGTRFVYAADEFYLKAEADIPGNDYYEDFPQIENGVGMLRAFSDEFINAIKKSKKMQLKPKEFSIVTGEAAHKFIKSLTDYFMSEHTGIKINVICIRNKFFGKEITVAGLLTGIDIIESLKGTELGDILLFPENALRSDDPVFLDDLTPSDLERELNIPVKAIKNDGGDLVNELLK